MTVSRDLTPEDTAWADHFPEPPRINMNAKKPRESFVFNGTMLFRQLERAILDYKPGEDIAAMDILEFGCGIGRCALPFFYKYQRPNQCIDMAAKPLEFLREVIPGANPQLSRYEPPLDFADDSFDVIYSISVWTHMTPEVGMKWLHEVKRMLKPGGLALLSTSSFVPLKRHREHPERSAEWGDVSDDDLRREGVIFRGKEMKGMGGLYGCTVHNPDWVAEHWSQVMPVLETRVNGAGGEMDGLQDLNIMQKPA
ncbi:MAG: class I SAM-dependent methyltransferase [Pseudomonadota bacterium]